ncbi:hypothetical protein AAFX91_26960 [Bradyrhizobium sp. 31Argb]|uniref:hypothetical protein n=1 Tax=unclassified Bradyrhizobium TaxID=2631580 RepID=UPI00102EA426|nr:MULTISPECIES: hypothetical protein [unclassified Bradyrhizobium]MDI4237367.1 hypothetical protein [Bradyrhizobium sp. Arg237L]
MRDHAAHAARQAALCNSHAGALPAPFKRKLNIPRFEIYLCREETFGRIQLIRKSRLSTFGLTKIDIWLFSKGLGCDTTAN